MTQIRTATENGRNDGASPPDGGGLAFARSEGWQALVDARDLPALASAWLALQCAQIERVEGGLVLLSTGDGSTLSPVALWPRAELDFAHLIDAGRVALQEKRVHSTRPKLNPAQPHESRIQTACPMEAGGLVYGVVVLDMAARPEAQITATGQLLFWGVGRLLASIIGAQHTQAQASLRRTDRVLDVIEVTLGQHEVKAACLALATQLAREFGCERVSLGLLRDGDVRVESLSNSAVFEEHSQLLSLIREAMEECVAFKRALSWPGEAPASLPAHAALSQDGDQQVLLSVPLNDVHRPVGALLFERKPGSAFSAEEIDVLTALGDVLGPLLRVKQEARRSLWAHAREVLTDLTARVFGPRHATFKFFTLIALVALLVLIFGTGEYRVTARTVVEGAVQRAAVAPFEGYIAEAYVRAGDTVKAGQPMARLEDKDLRLEMERWANEKEQYERKNREAMANQDRSNIRILGAQISQADAQLSLAQQKLQRTQILAPFDGVVVSGDLSQMVGSPVETGKVLFQVAPLSRYRVILKVDDRDIADVKVGQPGELVLAGLAREKLPFTVKTITSVSNQEDGRNYFRVEAQVDGAGAAMRPGMEGVGKIAAGERGLYWIITHNFTDWLRLKLWNWLP